MNELVIPPTSAVAIKSFDVSIKILDAPMVAIVPAMDIGRDCKREWFEQNTGFHQSPGCVRAAIDVRDYLLGAFLEVDNAYHLLRDALDAPLERPVAVAMLTVLY